MLQVRTEPEDLHGLRGIGRPKARRNLNCARRSSIDLDWILHAVGERGSVLKVE